MSTTAPPKMSREELVARIFQLRLEEGLTNAEIAERLGRSYSTICSALADPDGSKDRARKERYRGTCSGCGAPTTGCNGPNAAPTLCGPCTLQKQHDERFWTQERVIESLQRYYREIGDPLAMDFLHGNVPDWAPYPSVVSREFGSWNKGLEAAGIPTRPTGVQTPAGRQKIIEGLHARFDRERPERREHLLNRIREASPDGIMAPSTTGYPVLSQLSRYHFGSWDAACAEAGLTPRRPRISDEEVLCRLRDASVDGVAPPAKGSLHRLARRRFGTWPAACEAAGVRPRGRARGVA